MIFKIFFSNTIICFNKSNNDYVVAPKGYSYWFLFLIFSFPSLIAFYRKDYKMMIYLILLAFITMILVLISKFLTLISIIIYYGFLLYLSFSYNRLYLHKVLKLNYKFIDPSYANDEFIIDNFSESEIQDFLLHNDDTPQNYKSILVKKQVFRFFLSLLLFVIYIASFVALKVIIDNFVV